MNVCVLTWDFYQYDSRTRRETEAFIDREDSVDVICLRSDGDEKRGKFYGVNIYRIYERKRNEKNPLSYLIHLSIFFLLSFYWVTKLFIRKRYDVIHVHSVPDFQVFAALIPKLFGSKIILDIHDLVPEFYTQKFSIPQNSPAARILKFIERISIKFSDHVITTNDLWRNKLIERSVKGEKCTALLNFADPRLFFRKNHEKHKNFTLIYHGHAADYMGLDIAIKAMHLVKKENLPIQLLIYGGGPEWENLIELTNKMKLDDRVFFHQGVHLEKVPDIIRRAHAGVLPKRSGIFTDEAFSTKTLEYMAVGIPVIAAKNKVEEYYYKDSEVMFFEPGNEEDLARCILELYKSQEKQAELVKKGDQFLSKYNWDKYKQVFYRLIDNLTEKSETQNSH